jgi:hypothetical protein
MKLLHCLAAGSDAQKGFAIEKLRHRTGHVAHWSAQAYYFVHFYELVAFPRHAIPLNHCMGVVGASSAFDAASSASDAMDCSLLLHCKRLGKT